MNKCYRFTAKVMRCLSILPLAALLASATPARAQQGPAYVVYANYVYDPIPDVWFLSNGTPTTEPEDPGEGNDNFYFWDVFAQSNGTWARDWYDIGQWAQYDYETDTWSSSSHRPTHYLYYSGEWAYDTLLDGWFDETIDEGGGDWGPAGDPNIYNGPVYLLSGDGWEYSTIADTDYAYDPVTSQWYSYNSGTSGWDESDDPTANWVHLNIGSTAYAHDTVTGDWFTPDGDNWDAADDPTASWSYLTLDDVDYATDSITHDWFLADGDDWDSAADPTAHWSYVTIDSTDYAHDIVTGDWFSGSAGVWTSYGSDPRPSVQGPAYVVYASYVYDPLVDAWFLNNGTPTTEPEDPGEGNDNFYFWDAFVQSNGTWARDYYDVGYWAQYDYENETWSLSSHRPTHYLYYSGDWAYDTYLDGWFDETIDEGGGDWGPTGDPNIYNGPVYLLSGDDWEYSNVNSTDYAYDPVTTQWYVYDSGTSSWDESSDPNS